MSKAKIIRAAKKMKQARELLGEVAEARDDIWDARSWDWQESENGINYREHTGEIEVEMNQLDHVLHEMSDWPELEDFDV